MIFGRKKISPLLGLLLILSGLFFSTPVFALTNNCFCNYTTSSGQEACKVSNGYQAPSKGACKLSCENIVYSKSLDVTWIDPDAYSSIEEFEKNAGIFEYGCLELTENKSEEVKSEVENYLTPTLNVDIPGFSFSKVLESNGKLYIDFISQYINALYVYLLGAAAIIAVVMIMIGGVQYMIGSSVGSVDAARKRINNAVVGLVLLLGAYLILKTVNPSLVEFQPLALQYIEYIPLENLTVSDDSEAISCESGESFVTTGWQGCMLNVYGKNESEVKQHLTTVTFLGRSYQVNEAIVEDLQEAEDEIKEAGISYTINDGGGFNWRCNKNYPKYLSAHSWGTAIDINPSKNLNCPSACFDNNLGSECKCIGLSSNASAAQCESACLKGPDIPQKLAEIMESHGFNWLGNRKQGQLQDYMHFTYVADCPGG